MAQLSMSAAPCHSGKTVLSLLKSQWALSTACINRLKRTENGLTVNGERVFTNYILRTGDVLVVNLDAAEASSPIPPIPMPLDIFFEDEHLLVINKSAPLAVIPSSLAPEEPTLANGLAQYLGAEFSFHPVNRLDRGTTGLMIVAKSGYIHDQLRRSLHSGAFFRRYQGICVGLPCPDKGQISLPIGRAPGSAIQRQITADGQSALTEYLVLECRKEYSLLELTPHTGRTHQLRLHMAAIGHPLVGDWLYGTEDRSLIPRPALHAAHLSVRHPITGELLQFTAPMPADMKKVLEL